MQMFIFSLFSKFIFSVILHKDVFNYLVTYLINLTVLSTSGFVQHNLQYLLNYNLSHLLHLKIRLIKNMAGRPPAPFVIIDPDLILDNQAILNEDWNLFDLGREFADL